MNKKRKNILIGSACALLLLFIVVVAIINSRPGSNLVPSTTAPTTVGDDSLVWSKTNLPDTSGKGLYYYNSIKEALAKTPGAFSGFSESDGFSDGAEYLRTISHVVKLFESDQYAVLFYTSVKDQDTAGFTAVTFKIEKKNGKKQYAMMTATPAEFTRNNPTVIRVGSLKKQIQTVLKLNDYEPEFNVKNMHARFIWGGVLETTLYTPNRRAKAN